ncbi:MAG TPA: acetolactate synthase large subunit [Acidimicrobiales bacterium]
MNGAQSLVATLTGADVTVCFANPGTSEMHFVAALDRAPDLRGVLCLFEGVATGAADGYGRLLDRPAATLLHLGPGLANGLANLHNARRARTPIVNVVGDHATYHKRFDAPLESDIDALAGTVSCWVRRPSRPQDVGADTAAAVAAARSGGRGIATLILPADVSWGKEGVVAAVAPPRPAAQVADSVVADVATALSGDEPAVLLLGGQALREPALSAAARVAVATGCRVVMETFTPRVERGRGRPVFERLGYFSEMAEAQLAGTRHLVLAGAAAPVAFFAYPERASDLVPAGCQVHLLAGPADDVPAALAAVAERVGAPPAPPTGPAAARPVVPAVTATLSAEAVGSVIGAGLPEGAVLVDEAITATVGLAAGTAGAAPHDWLGHTGGAIGQGLPIATGAAVALVGSGRRVVSVEADGSAMYTIQALWTQARESLDITTIILNNRAYAILQIEMHRVQADPPGPSAAALLDLGQPTLDVVALAGGFGVPGVRVTTAGELDSAFRRSLAQPGPFLIDAVLPGR